MMPKLLQKIFLLGFLTGFLSVHAQDLHYTQKTTKILTSKKYWGRGYTKQGMEKAAGFLAKEYKKIGLLPMGNEGYMQFFDFAVNTFPGKIALSIDGRRLVPGKDFLITPSSTGLRKTSVLLEKTDSITYASKTQNVFIEIKEKLTWPVATAVNRVTKFQVLRTAFITDNKVLNAEIEVENAFIHDFEAANVAGMVKGTKYPDSLILITAHYDHLGGMGKNTYFPGANDNASGVAFLLDLARHYVRHPPEYSVGFICFAAEEAGLIGSRYFTENPLVDLGKIKFLLNLDLMGNGDQGITVVNATVFPKQFALLNKVNLEGRYITKISARGKAANSDHYWFSEKGVPAFFIYTQGGGTAYHDVFDTAANISFPVYAPLFTLIEKFIKAL